MSVHFLRDINDGRRRIFNRSLYFKPLHTRVEVCTVVGTAGIPRILRYYRGNRDEVAGLPRGWKQTLRDYRGDGDEFLRYHRKNKIILFYKK